jgi:phosphatidate phosphatase APP1
VQTDSNGRFAASVTVPVNSPVGSSNFVAVGAQKIASTPFAVTRPFVTLQPAAVGGQANLIAGGLPPNTAVTFELGTRKVTQNTDSNGSVSAPITAPPAAGIHTIKVTSPVTNPITKKVTVAGHPIG